MSKISIAVSAALAASAMGAAATADATAVLTTGASHFFPTSGSTALNNAINEFFVLNGGPCAGSTTNPALITVYTDGTFKPSTGQFSGFHQILAVCNAAQAFGTTVASGSQIAIAKESNGGSLEGTIDVATQTALAFLDPLNSNGISCTNASGGGSGTQNVSGVNQFNAHEWAFTVNTGCTVSGSYAPTLGWADEYPQAWLSFGNRPVTQGDINNLTTTPLVQNVFGIAVSLNLYRALQSMQNKTVGDDTLANMPSISAPIVNALYQGQFNWGQVVNAAGNPVTAGAFVPTGGLGPNGNTVYLCRRGDSSGTNAFVDLQFIGNRCNANGIAQLAPGAANSACKGLPPTAPPGSAVDYGCTWLTANNGTDTVFAGAGGGDVAACLDYHDLNNDYAIGNLTTNQVFGGPLEPGSSTRPATDTGTNTHFRYVAIDGHNPALVNVANGQYPYVEDDVLNTHNPDPNSAVTAMGTFITKKFTTASVVLDFDLASQQTSAETSAAGHAVDPDWYAGLLFDAASGLGAGAPNAVPTTTAAIVTGAGANPTSDFSQLGTTGVLNNCVPPTGYAGAVNP